MFIRKNSFVYTLLFLVFVVCSKDTNSIIHKNMKFAHDQYSQMLAILGDSVTHPRTVNDKGMLHAVPSRDWTSGFFPGSLWFLYQYTKADEWKEAARTFTSNLEEQQFNSGTHDTGFKMLCSYGNGHRLTGNEKYKKILLQSAKTLITRFNSRVGCIRSWDHHKHLWQYPVIIDNVMNLELLFWATKASGDSTYYDIAVQHADKTIKNHFREDYSTWHVVDYDTVSGQVLGKYTHQGYANESTWSRGQAWALYGYTMCYRETGKERYLLQAQNIADFILTQENLPDDCVPYWDFNAPDIPNEERDVSAAAIICSALIELCKFTDAEKKYEEIAEELLHVLSSSEYRSETGENNNFLLKHAVGNKRGNSEVDVPLIYADYYFLEANLRKLQNE